MRCTIEMLRILEMDLLGSGGTLRKNNYARLITVNLVLTKLLFM